MARFTATEMVGVPLTCAEVRRLLDALEGGRPGAADVDVDDDVLRRKLTVMLQVAEAGERRRAAEAGADGPIRRRRRPR